MKMRMNGGVRWNVGTTVMDDIAPLRVGKERRNDITEVDQGEEQQDALDDAKRPPQNQKPDQQGSHRDRGVASDVAEQELGRPTDAGKFRDGRGRVGEEEEDHHPERRRDAKALANQV